MDMEKITQLIQEFSNANLTSFTYEEGNLRIKLKKESDGTIKLNGDPVELESDNEDFDDYDDDEDYDDDVEYEDNYDDSYDYLDDLLDHDNEDDIRL